MDIRDRRALKTEAQNALGQAFYDPKKLVLIYVGAMAALLMAATGLNYLLGLQIEDTGGLSGLSLRSILESIQSVLQMVTTVVLPFWEMGYFFAALRLARRETAEPETLLEGFRKFGPVLRFNLLKSLLFIAVAFLCFYPSMILFLVTPLSDPLSAIVETLLADGSVLSSGELVLDDAALYAMMEALIPMLVIFVVVYLVVMIPVYYRFRMGHFALAEDPKAGAFAALRKSSRKMKGNRMKLFKLDLSFWWFYVLEAALMAVGYGDTILSLLGVELPISADVAYFLFYALYLVGLVALYYIGLNRVQVTYAVAYDAMKEAPQKMPRRPMDQPWEE